MEAITPSKVAPRDPDGMSTDLELSRYDGETETVYNNGGERNEDSGRVRLGILALYAVEATTVYGRIPSAFETDK